jgi:hypothetical protein
VLSLDYIISMVSGKELGGRRDWLMSWLGQQSPVFYSQASGRSTDHLPVFHHPVLYCGASMLRLSSLAAYNFDDLVCQYAITMVIG